jgi:hypothetical protein
MVFQCRFDGDGNADTTDCDEVVSASMAHAFQRIHFGVDAKSPPTLTLLKLSTPCSVQSEEMFSDVKAMAGHESGQKVVRKSTLQYEALKKVVEETHKLFFKHGFGVIFDIDEYSISKWH